MKKLLKLRLTLRFLLLVTIVFTISNYAVSGPSAPWSRPKKYT